MKLERETICHNCLSDPSAAMLSVWSKKLKQVSIILYVILFLFSLIAASGNISVKTDVKIYIFCMYYRAVKEQKLMLVCELLTTGVGSVRNTCKPNCSVSQANFSTSPGEVGPLRIPTNVSQEGKLNFELFDHHQLSFFIISCFCEILNFWIFKKSNLQNKRHYFHQVCFLYIHSVAIFMSLQSHN